MNFIQEVLSLLERKQNKKTLDLKRDWFEFGRTKPSNVGNPLYSPKMTPHAIRFDDLKCEIITGLVQGTGSRYTLPMWDEHDPTNCNVQTMVDSIFSQDAGATEGLVTGDFKVTGNTILEGDLLVLGQQTIVESTVVQVADNIFRINSGGTGVDAGIEVMQPGGVKKTWAWDFARGAWSTFGESIITEDITIGNAINMDGESLVNVVNEAEGLLSQDNDASIATVAAIIDYVTTATAGTNSVDKAEYEVMYTTDPGLTQAGPGQLIFNQATDEIYMSWFDLNNNDRKYALETILYSPGKKPFGLFTADIDDPWVNYNAQYFNPCNIEFLGVNCLPWDGTTPNLNPTQGSTGDDGGIGVPIQIVWSSSAAAIKQGGQGAVYATVYVHPDVVGQTIQTPVMSGSGLSFANEPIDDPKALATAFSNSAYVTFNPPLADPFTIYLNSSMTTIAGGGYYMERTEFDNLPSGSFGYISNWDDASQSWNKDVVSFTNPAATAATGDPELVCTIDSRSLEVRIQGADQFIIPWIEGQEKGTGWHPATARAIVTLDMAGKETCIVEGSSNGVAFDETITDVAYNPDQNILGHVDEEGVISIMPLAGADGYISQVALNGTDLEFTGTVDAFTGTIDLSSLLDDTNLARITSGAMSGTELVLTRDDATTVSIDLSSLADTDTNDIDYVSDVQLSGTDLQFTGVGNGFSGTVNLSSLAVQETLTVLTYVGNTDALRYTDENGNNHAIYGLGPQSLSLSNTDLSIVRADGTVENTVSLASLGGGGMALSDVVAGDKINVSVNGVAGTVTVSHQTTTTTPTTSSTILTGGGTFDAIVGVTHDAYGHITGYDTRTFTMPATGAGADGNDFVSNVTFDSNTSVLDFTGSGGAFNGSINLAALADTETLTSLQFSGGNLIYTDENNNGTNIAAIDIAPVQSVVGDGTALSSSYDTGTGQTMITPIFNNVPSQNSQALVTSGGIWSYIDALTFPNDIDYISNVALNGNSLDFTGTGNAFAGSIDLSSFLDNTDTEYSLSVAGQAAGARVSLNGTNGNVDSVDFLPGSGISMSLANNQLTIASTVTDTNDIDFVQDVVLNGTDLQFTGTGNAFSGTIDLSSFLDDTNTNTTYDLSSGQNGNNVDITLDGSDSTADSFTLVAGTNITLTDDGSNNITIDAAGGSASYTFGTYLTETSGTVNHDSTTRSDTTSTQTASHGGTVRVIDSVTTNATGHITAVNQKTVTLPTASEACMFGVNFQPLSPQTLQSQFFVIGQGTPNFPLGFTNNSNEDRRYVLTWSVQLSAAGGGTGVKSLDLRVVLNSQTVPSTLMEWNDSQYTASEYQFTRTYTYTTGPIASTETIEIQIAGDTALSVVKAHLSVVDVTCDSLQADDAQLLNPRN